MGLIVQWIEQVSDPSSILGETTFYVVKGAQTHRLRALYALFQPFLRVVLTVLSSQFVPLLQVAGCQRLADMPSFALQNMAF